MRKFLAIFMVLVVILALAACGAPAGTAATELNDMVTVSATEDILAGTEFGGTTIKVSTVDEFLAALGPDRTIQLAAGHYDLDTASGYGKISENPYYSWRIGYDDYALCLNNLRNLTVIGSGMEQTFLETRTPGNKILELVNCENVTFCALAVGCWENMPGWGRAAAIDLEGCNGIKLEKMEFFSCGSIGIEAVMCQDLTVSESRLYGFGSAAHLFDCQGVSFRNCEIYNIGKQTEMDYYVLYNDGGDVTVEGGSISYCDVDTLVETDGKNGTIQIKSTLFRGNEATEAAFGAHSGTITLDNCSFEENTVETWILNATGRVEDADGNELNEGDFEQDFVGMPVEEDTPWQEITVSNIDEFLAALGSNREIRLAPGTYNLQDASDYGRKTSSPYYEWEDADDGYTLVLKDLKDVTIVGSGTEQTFIETLPRSVAVLFLDSCKEITIRDMTMGHVEMADLCEGPVLELNGCIGVNLEGLGLYGCGVTGVEARSCKKLTVNNCHIYDCSMFGLYLYECDGVGITNCAIDHIGGISVLSVDCCTDLVMDRCTVSDCGVDVLIDCWEAPESIVIKNTTFRGNTTLIAAFAVYRGRNIILDNCTFEDNDVDAWYDYDKESCVEDANGTIMTASDFVETRG